MKLSKSMPVKTSFLSLYHASDSLFKLGKLLIPLLPSGKTQLMERDALGVVGQAGFAKNK